MSRADRGLAMHPDYRDFGGEWIGPVLVVNKMPRKHSGKGGARRSVWRCWHSEKRRDVYLRTATLKRLEREREAELAEHWERLAADGGG